MRLVNVRDWNYLFPEVRHIRVSLLNTLHRTEHRMAMGHSRRREGRNCSYRSDAMKRRGTVSATPCVFCSCVLTLRSCSSVQNTKSVRRYRLTFINETIAVFFPRFQDEELVELARIAERR